MVVLHFKKSKGNEFLFETTTAILNDDLYTQLCEGKSPAIFISHILYQFFSKQFAPKT